MRKRILSLVLAFCMVLTLLPTTAFAAAGSNNNEAKDETREYATLAEAVEAATGDEATETPATITLLKNVELGEAVTVSKSVTIVGDGHTISRGKTEESKDYTGTFFTVSDGATLTLSNVIIDAGGKWSIDEEKWAADLELSLGQGLAANDDPFKAEAGNVNTTEDLIVLNGASGLTLNDGTVIKNMAGANGEINVIGIGVSDTSKKTVTIENASIQHVTSPGASLIFPSNGYVAFTLKSGASLTDNFARLGNGGLFYLNTNTSTMTMEDGAKVTNNRGFNCNGTFIMARSGATFTMNGGEISGNVGVQGATNHYCQPVYAHENGQFIMNDGSIINNTGSYAGAVYQYIAGGGEVQLNGGTIKDNHYYGEDDHIMDESSFGQVFLTNESTIGEDMTITGDVSFYGQSKATVSGDINGNVYIFAEQHTSTNDNNVELEGTITGNVIVENGAKATNTTTGTITGNVTVEPQDATDSNHSEGTFTNNGTISGTVTLEPDTSIKLGEETVSVDEDAESGAEFSVSGKTVTMNKGTVKASGTGVTFQNADGEPLDVGQDGTVVVPAAQITKGVTTTTYGTLKDAVAEAKENDTVELLTDVELGSAVNVDKTLTIKGAEGVTVTRTADHTGTFFTVSGAGVTLTLSGVNIDADGDWTLDQEKYDAALEKSMAGTSASDTAGIIITKDAVETTAHLITLADGASLDVNGGSKITNFYTSKGQHIIQITSGNGSVSLTACVISHGASANQFIVNDANSNDMNEITVGSGCVIEDNFVLGNGGLFLVGCETTLKVTDGAKIIDNTTCGNGIVAMIYDYAGNEKVNKMIMSGGEISGNVGIYTGANHFGSPIYVHLRGEFEMTGGSIINNTGAFVGAIMENERATSVKITGGIIKDNYYVHNVPEDMAKVGYPSAGMGEIFIGADAAFSETARIDGDLYVGMGGQLENKGTINADTYVYASKSEDIPTRVAHFNNEGTVNGTLTAQNGATVNNSGAIGDLVVNNEVEKKDSYKSTDGTITNTGAITGTVTLTGGASVQLNDAEEAPPTVTAGTSGATFTVDDDTVTLREGTLTAKDCGDINFRDTANNELVPADGNGNGEVMIVVARVTHGSGLSEGFDNFADAVAEAARLSKNGGTYTVTLLKDAEGDGIDIASGASVVVDFNGHTYTLTGSPVGSGTQYATQGIRPLAGSTVTLKNGTLAVSKDNGTFDKNFIWLIHNYGDLTVENMTLDGTNLVMPGNPKEIYTLNSNYGKVSITKTTFIDSNSQADGDVYSIRALYSASSAYKDVSQIIIDDESVFKNIFVARSAETTKEFVGMMVYVEYNDVKYGIDATDKTADSYIVFTKTGDTLTPVLPDSTLSYTALANKDIVETCVAETMWVQFNEALPKNTWLWFKITDEAEHTYGIVGHADEDGLTKMAWSFLNKGQFEMWPDDVDAITGGTYTVTCYVLPGKVEGPQTTEPEPMYLAWTKTVEVGNVSTYVPTKPEVSVDENKVSEDDIGAVTSAAESTAVDEAHMTELASEALADAENALPTTDEAKDALGDKADEDATVQIVVETYLDVTVTNYVTDEGRKQLTFEIKPMYQIVATTAESVDDIKVGTNAVEIGEAKELTVTNPVTMTLGVPENFLGDDAATVYVKHVKDNGRTYYYRATANEDNTAITFRNTHGFSEFTVIVTEPEAEAQIGDTLYPTLQAAIDHVKDGETIEVLTGEALTVTAPAAELSFRIVAGKDVDAIDVTVSSNGNYRVTVDGSTYTVKNVGTSSGSSAPAATSTVVIETAANGTVTVSDRNAKAGDTVTVTPKADEGCTVDTVVVTDKDGKDVAVTKNADGTYTFTMPEKASQPVTVKVTFRKAAPSEKFVDVDRTAWYAEAVDYVVENGLMNGTGETTFEPSTQTTRAMLVTILYRLEGKPAATKDIPFSDVAAGEWYSDAINWAAANGIVDGYGDDTFRPMRNITREEAAAILYRYADYKKYDVTTTDDLTGYTDAGTVSAWANTYMGWAVGTELIQGTTETTLAPTGGAVRAQIAIILMRFCENIAK